MKIVTTGATGFLGKSICDRLKDKHKFFHIASEGINKSIFPSIKDVDYDVHQPKRIVFTFDSCLKKFY